MQNLSEELYVQISTIHSIPADCWGVNTILVSILLLLAALPSSWLRLPCSKIALKADLFPGFCLAYISKIFAGSSKSGWMCLSEAKDLVV